LFARYFAQPRNADALSAELKLEGKSAVEVLQEYAVFWKNKGLEYQPRKLLETFLRFTFERNTTREQIVKAVFVMVRFFRLIRNLRFNIVTM
jgi:hypothetical protein